MSIVLILLAKLSLVSLASMVIKQEEWDGYGRVLWLCLKGLLGLPEYGDPDKVVASAAECIHDHFVGEDRFDC
jgi:hypothetical protein